MRENTRVVLASHPEGVPTENNFRLEKCQTPVLDDGQVLCETVYLSLDPYMRSQIAGRHISGAVGVGETLRGEVVARVLESRNSRFSKGELVRCMAGWQRFSVQDGGALLPVPESMEDPAWALSVLGMPGLTAYAGLIWQAQPTAGETILVPAATGGVGSVVGQLAKEAGCRVIGIAGSDEKCRVAVDQLGYDHCINRRRESVAERLPALCPQGVDIYFDLVGGETLDIASRNLATGARVILCGLIEDYNRNDVAPRPGPPPALWIIARARVHGLVVYDFEPRRAEFVEACLPLVNSGRLNVRHDVSAGLEAAPAAFCRLMRGENNGKVLVKL